MLSAMVLAPVPEQWLGAGQDGHPQLPDAIIPPTTHLGTTTQPCIGVGLGVTFNAARHYRHLVVFMVNSSP